MGASTFIQRTPGHDELVLKTVRDLKCWGFTVYDNGRENTHPGMPINLLTDPGSREIRFKPDLSVIASNRTVFLDCKDSQKIEKDPYDTYIEMSDRGIPVYVVAKFGERVKVANVRNIQLGNGNHNVWPTINGWITPRAHQNYDYLKLHYPPDGRPYPGSGTPFRSMLQTGFEDWSYMRFAFELNWL